MISRESAQVLGLLVCFCFLAWSYLQAETWWKERTASDREKRAEADMVKEPEPEHLDKKLLAMFEQRQEEVCVAIQVIHALNARLHPDTRTDSEREEDAKQVELALQALAEKYGDITCKTDSLSTLTSEVSILSRIVPDLIEPEFIAIALQCDVDTAAKAISLVAENEAEELS